MGNSSTVLHWLEFFNCKRPPEWGLTLIDEQVAAVDALGHAFGFGGGTCHFLVVMEICRIGQNGAN
jgi:hypothetical protein